MPKGRERLDVAGKCGDQSEGIVHQGSYGMGASAMSSGGEETG